MSSKRTLLITLPLSIIFGLGIIFFWQKIQDLNNQIDDLEYEKEDLKDQVDDLESERDDAISEKEEYEALYTQLLETVQETQNRNHNSYQNSYSNYSNSNSYNNSYSNNSKNNTSIDIPSKLSRIYFDGGYIVKPSFGNLHNLMSLSMSEFKGKMIEHNYNLSTDGESYISDGATNCCYSIDKEWNSVSMVFTKEVDSDIEVKMLQSNIDYTYDDAFKKYSYKIEYDSYILYYKSSYQGVAVILKKY